MAKFNFNLRNHGKLSICPINLVIRYNNQILVYPTEERIRPEYWNKTNQRAKITKIFPEATYLNERLGYIELEAKQTFRAFLLNNNNRIPSISELRKELNLRLRRGPNLAGISFFEFIDKFIEEAKSRTNPRTGRSIARSTIQIYKHTFQLLKDYASAKRKTIDFRDVDLEFFYDFVEFLKSKRNLSNNTIGKHISAIKLIMNDATERGLNDSIAYRSKRFQLKGEHVEKIYLTEQELEEISKLNLEDNKRLDRVRDLFLVGCWTGLRFSDLSLLTKENFDNGNLRVRTHKTDEEVVIPVHPVVKSIIKKYEGEERILPTMISNAKMNEYLKEVMALVPELTEPYEQKVIKDGKQTLVKKRKCDLVTVHTARRSFATNLYLGRFPTVSIMKITGHRTESAFLEYLKITPTENAELLKMHWESKLKSSKKRKKKT